MAGILINGQRSWQMDRDQDGHRTYRISHHVLTDGVFVVTGTAVDPTPLGVVDGPFIVMNTPGLPVVGSSWAFDNDLDPFAYCWPTMTVRILQERKGDPANRWIVEQIFSTKSITRCQDTSVESPLDEPDKVSGSFVKFTREAISDKDGDPILNSAHEPIRGPTVEIDDNRPTVRIEKNVSVLPLETFSEFVDTLNDSELWGLPARSVKLSNVSWERKLFGVCFFYYTVIYEFDIDFTTFDRTILDEGNVTLKEGGTQSDPRDYNQYKDAEQGENRRVVLDGAGDAWDGTDDPGPGGQVIQFYEENNFFLLDIPDTL